MIKPNRLYFVENDEVVTVSDGLMNSSKYKSIVDISKLKKILDSFCLNEKKEFEDMLIFSDQFVEITVWLNDKEDFYSDEDNKTKDINLYSRLVQIIIIDIIQPDKRNVEIIDSIMKTFNLNIYSAEENKHYKDTNTLAKVFYS